MPLVVERDLAMLTSRPPSARFAEGSAITTGALSSVAEVADAREHHHDTPLAGQLPFKPAL
jgi:hypothetical protein